MRVDLVVREHDRTVARVEIAPGVRVKWYAWRTVPVPGVTTWDAVPAEGTAVVYDNPAYARIQRAAIEAAAAAAKGAR